MRKSVMSALIFIALLGFVIAGCAAPTGIKFKPEAPSESTSTSGGQLSSTAQAPSRGLVEGYEIYENKDPFQPLTGTGATQQVTTATVATPTGLAHVTLVSIAANGSSASFSVDGTDYANISVGATFASYFKLLSIGTTSVTILYGDSQYTLAVGETLTLK